MIIFRCTLHTIKKGYVTEGSGRSSKPKKAATVGPRKSRRRSQSANGIKNSSTMSSRTLSRNDITSHRASRSKYRTPGQRIQTMSADRSIMMTPVTPKIQMNTPVSLLRYPKVGETVISMSGSPVIVNG